MQINHFLVLLGLSLVAADTPANCLYEDILGTWMFFETERLGNRSETCDTIDKIVYIKEFTLTFPNTATDELGNAGTWTMVYNQGFEVNINERSYFAFSYYELNGATATSYCTKTLNGWSRDRTVRNWSCFFGMKNVPAEPRSSPISPNSRSDHMYKIDYELINKINSIQKSWTAKAYPELEKYTVEEILRRNGGIKIPNPPPPAPASHELKAKVALLPQNFDWRDVEGVNYVTPVRDQQSCGSCYIFCSMAALESRVRIGSRMERTDIFSPQDVVSCSRLSQGCAGGFNYLVAGRYAQDQGVVAEVCNAYTGKDDECVTDPSCSRTYVSRYEYLGGFFGGCNEELMMEALVTHGPLPVSYEVYDDFSSYTGGIYHHTELSNKFNPLEPVNHGVLLVGYGVDLDTGEKYWSCKNSWGSSWGESGFFRIRRGTNECAIESMAVDFTVIP